MKKYTTIFFCNPSGLSLQLKPCNWRMNVLCALLPLLFIATLTTCKKAPDAPTGSNKIEIGQTTADSVAYFTAKVSTNISSAGGNTITQHGHCWSTETKPTTEDNKTTLGKLDAPKTYSSQLAGLVPNTNYYIRSYATCPQGTVYGNEKSIKTLETGKPVVTTAVVTNITINSAQSGGAVSGENIGTITARGVCWNTTGSPTLQNNLGYTTDGSGTGSFTSSITGLTENTTYYVAAYATNEKGTGYGEVKSFKTYLYNIPVVTTDEITEITNHSAKSGGAVSGENIGTITARGVCWNTTGSPTLQNNTGHTTDGSGTGNYTSNITGLTDNTTYYVAAYATNEEGTAYGQVKSFLATNDFTDPRDGQTYATVVIGSQTWFAENLNYETSNSWWYDNSSTNGDVYGRLYTWSAAKTACPSGWHLPSDNEWKTLEMQLGMSQSEADDIGWRGTDEGKKMKSTSGWNNNGNGTNSSGFTALPGGYRGSNGSFRTLGYYGRWWSSTESSGTRAWSRSLNYDYDQVRQYYLNKALGFSVRCLKN